MPDLQDLKMPQHVAIILDGNGRWAKNKGYPTREHRLAVRRYGVTPYHRLTFNHESGQLELF